MINTIGFDADDTLWHNEHLYHNAKKIFSEILSKFRDADTILANLNKTEVENIAYYGYGIKGFALSMIEVALDISRGQVTSEQINEIIAISRNMLKAPVELVPGAEATLKELADTYDLMLITKGDSFEQERKIELSGIAHFFRYREVVGEKSEKTYGKILSQYNLEPARFVMVGNSLRSDVLPVLKIGGQAVHIPNEFTWFNENASREEIGDAKFAQLENLSQLPDYIAGLD